MLLATGEAAALGLGKMTVLSRLGAHFEAEVQLLDAAPEKQLLADCFRLGQTGNSDVPLLTRGRVTVEQRAGGLHLRIVSDQTINEPLLQVSLRAGCGAEVVRNYLLLIDPPIVRATQGPLQLPAAQPTAPAVAEPPFGRTPASGKQQAMPPGVNSRPAPEREAQPNLLAKRQVPRRLPPAGNASDRLLLSAGTDNDKAQVADDPPLRLSSRLSTHLLNRSTENQRSILRIEYKLLTALHTQAEQQLAVAQQVRQLESALKELQQKSAGQARTGEQIASPVETTRVSGSAKPIDVQPREKPRSSTAAPSAGKKAEEPDWWLEAGVLLGLTAAVAWWLRRRSGRTSEMPEISAPTEKPTPSARDAGWKLEAIDRANSQIVPASVLPGDATRASSLFPEKGEDDKVTDVLELAEIMVSFGRLKGAQQALEEFIQHQPKAAVTPWLKLLQIHRQSEQRSAFEALALQLRRNFNVAPADWEASGELAGPAFSGSDTKTASIEQLLARLPTIGKLPHIRTEILRTWGSPACLAYLDKLLRDNRDGARQGFALGAVQELLFLMDLLESRLKPPA